MDLDGDTTATNCNGTTELQCRDNELGYMYYYNLSGSLDDDLTGDQGLIQNIQFVHWSGTEGAGSPFNAWLFSFEFGIQGALFKGNSKAAWAVRPGDVAIIPLPGAIWLLLSGLLGLAGMRRNRRQH